MTSLTAEPLLLTAAAADARQINAAIGQAMAAAAGPTTSVVAAARDEVSAITAQLFGAHGQQYQSLLQQAAAFHEQFATQLAAAGSAYAQTEAVIMGTLASGAAPANPVFGAVTTAADPAVNANLIMTGSGTATPSTLYVHNVASRYLTAFSGPLQAVSTAEGLYPFTGVKDLTLNTSLARDLTELNNAIVGVLGPAPSGKVVSVLGYSQSSIVSSLEMPKLLAEGYTSSNAYFTLLGDPSNPNGGLFARFPGLNLPSLGVTFGTATPSNDFPTTIWTLEYDGFADFPRYPIDVLADVNALAGIVFVHGTYPTLTATQLNSAVTLPQSGAPSMTTYNMIPTQNLPLLEPLRAIPGIGNPLADLVQPDLKYLINWGYGNPLYGWSTGPADVATPFGFLPPLHDTTSLPPLLVSGARQGFGAFASDLAAEIPTSLPPVSLPGIAHSLLATSPGSAPLVLSHATSPQSTITDLLKGVESANNNVVGGLTTAFSTAYATLLPTADIATAVVVSIPSYDVNLFINGIIQAVNGDPVGLINAIGNPIAADVGLTTLAGGFELISIGNAVDTIVTGTPHPGPF